VPRRQRPLLARSLAVGLAATTAGSLLVPGTAAAAPPPGPPATGYQGGSEHDGSTQDPSFVRQIREHWSVDLGGRVHYPLVVGGRVYASVSDPDGAGSTVSAFELESGTRIWGPVDVGGTNGFGALTYEGGRVFAMNGQGRVTALDAASGTRAWSTAPGQSLSTSFPLASHRGLVYTSGQGPGGARISALAAREGSLQWTRSVPHEASSAPAVDDTGVYVGYGCDQVYAFSGAGSQRWHHEGDCADGGGSAPVLHGSRLYVQDPSDRTPILLDTGSGEQVGTFASDTAPAVDGDTVVTVTDGVLRVLDARNGALRWSDDRHPWVSNPLLVNGDVIVGASDGVVHLLDGETGADLWSATAGSEIRPPGEGASDGLTGLAVGHGHLVVPAGTRLTVFGPSAPQDACRAPDQVIGAIRDHYQRLGGPCGHLGAPTTDEVPTPDRFGRFTFFQHGAIYWSPATGAHEVRGAIRDEWGRLQWENGPLGFPTSDELAIPREPGAYQSFQGGTMYWSHPSGAHFVRGAIADTWSRLGAQQSHLGFPTTNELPTPYRPGAFNHFRNGSIYWSPATGSHEVRGAIRDAWEGHWWEAGPLGFPTSDEYSTGFGVRRSDFEGGYITWTQQRGTTVHFAPR